MIIFQRVVTLSGPPQEVAEWATEITGLVNERTPLDVSLWQGISGGPVGTLAWSALVQSMTVLEAATDTLAGDSGYADLVSKAVDWRTAPGEDHILRMVHSAGGEYERPGVGAYAEGTRAVPAEGKLAKAAAWGVDIADIHAELTHSAVLFCTAEYGAFGELRWLGLYPSAAALDQGAEAIAKDDSYTKKLDQAGDLFVEGSAQRTLARRIA